MRLKNFGLNSAHLVLALSTVIAIGSTVMMGQANKKLVSSTREEVINILDGINIRTGDFIPSMNLLDLDNRPHEIDFRNRATHQLIQISSVHCGMSYSQRVEWWPQITSDPRLAFTSPVMVSVESPEEVIENIPYEELVGTMLSPDPKSKFRRTFRIASVPVLLLVSPDGEVSWCHHGKLTDERYEELLEKVANFNN